MDIDTVVSTGSGIALSYMPLARARGIPCHYMESAARSDGPSRTGRILCRVHGVHLYTQYPGLANATVAVRRIGLRRLLPRAQA